MKIICFSSYTSIWFYSFAEAVIANQLQCKGHEVLFVTPGREFPSRSNLMNERILRKEFELKGYDLSKVITKKDREIIDDLLRNLTKDNFQNLVVDNINIGKIALYEFLLGNKKISAELTANEWEQCFSEIKATLTSLFACRKVIKQENPDRLLLYNTLYSVNHVWERYADQMGIPVYFMGNGGNLSDMQDTLVVGKNHSINFINKVVGYWKVFKDIPVSQKDARYITDHFLELLRAKNGLVYSAPKSKQQLDIRKIFGIKHSQNIVTATMSSHDEMFAANYVGVANPAYTQVFDSQTDWIMELIKYVKTKPNLFLIIRVHPREFPNSRGKTKSGYAKKLRKILNNLPPNVRVNWPTDYISLYDLAENTCVFLNAWSTTGVEMSMLGIPVVLYAKQLVSYPPDLNYVARDRGNYFLQIEKALQDGWSYKRIKKTYRWLALNHRHTIIRYRKFTPATKPNIKSKSTLNIQKYILKLLPAPMRSVMTNLYLNTIQKIKDKHELQLLCHRQLIEKIDVRGVETMLLNSSDTLVDIKHAMKGKVTTKQEDGYLHTELIRISTAMYGNIPKDLHPKKGSLRYNLQQITQEL